MLVCAQSITHLLPNQKCSVYIRNSVFIKAISMEKGLHFRTQSGLTNYFHMVESSNYNGVP